MNTKTTFDTTDDSPNNEEKLLALKKEFQDILDNTPEEEKAKLTDELLSDLWDLSHINRPSLKGVIIGGGDIIIPPLPTRTVKLVGSTPNLDKNFERLALLKYHNCALKPKPNEDAFSQALRTIFMKDNHLDDGNWDYLKDKSVEPVTYNIPFPNKSKFFSKARWKNYQEGVYKILRKILFKNDPREIQLRRREKIAIEYLESFRGQV